MTSKKRRDASASPKAEAVVAPQSNLRLRILRAASELLAAAGTEGVTTRAVAEAAGVQTPALYRFFQDKTALLDALVEFGFAAYLATKPPVSDREDPITALRKGWDVHVEFGLSHPALYRLMYAHGRPGLGSAAAAYGAMQYQIARAAAAGRLRLGEARAARFLQAAACGLVFTLLSMPEADRDMSLSRFSREAALAAIALDVPVVDAPTTTAVAVAMRARLGDVHSLTEMERGLMEEWLDRIVDAAVV